MYSSLELDKRNINLGCTDFKITLQQNLTVAITILIGKHARDNESYMNGK